MPKNTIFFKIPQNEFRTFPPIQSLGFAKKLANLCGDLLLLRKLIKSYGAVWPRKLYSAGYKEKKETGLRPPLCPVPAWQDIEQVIYDPANSILRPLSCPALYNTCLIIVLLNITFENWYMRSLSNRWWIRSRFVTMHRLGLKYILHVSQLRKCVPVVPNNSMSERHILIKKEYVFFPLNSNSNLSFC